MRLWKFHKGHLFFSWHVCKSNAVASLFNYITVQLHYTLQGLRSHHRTKITILYHTTEGLCFHVVNNFSRERDMDEIQRKPRTFTFSSDIDDTKENKSLKMRKILFVMLASFPGTSSFSPESLQFASPFINKE